MTSVVDRMTSASNTYSTGPYTLMSTEPCMMPGSPAKMPMALDAAMSRPMTVMASTLPSAISRLLMGVARSVAMVPRSFSPATDSAAMDMTLLNTRMSSRSGTMDTTSMPATSRSSATS